MQVFEDWLSALREEGRLTLQVPMFTLSFPGTVPDVNYVEIPDEWLCRLKSSNEPAVGKETGFVHISRVGYEANRQEILTAFAAGAAQRHGWSEAEAVEEFENYAQEHFAEVERLHDLKLERTRMEVELRDRQGSLTPYWESKLSELEEFPV